MSIVDIPQLIYWGNISTWTHIIKHQSICLFSSYPYTYFKGHPMNRCAILSSQGILRLSIPIQGGRKNHIPYQDIQIDYTTRWQLQHQKSIQSCYGKSPFWEEYQDEIFHLYHQKHKFLLDWNQIIYDWLAQCLGVSIHYTNDTHFSSINNYTVPIYKQLFSNTFIPQISIIDTLLCQGEKQLAYLLRENINNSPQGQ